LAQTGELVPVPEPKAIAASIALLAFAGWRFQKKSATLWKSWRWCRWERSWNLIGGAGGVGCPQGTGWIVHAFIAKAVYQFPTTKALLEALQARPTLRRLCGWESLGRSLRRRPFREPLPSLAPMNFRRRFTPP